MKRLIDIALSLAAVGLLLPVFLLVALAIWVDDGRPIFFRQLRVGKGDREFGMFKFRSMVKNAAVVGPYYTSADDSRITRTGRFIRRTSIDELPQLLNVLMGDMSLVGPRPDVPAQRAHYNKADWSLRCSVRPGVTGLAQARLRSAATPQERLDLDLRYVREHSLGMDIKIMALTLGRLSGKGSN